MTTKFRITWPNGMSTVEAAEADTVDAYAMSRWGANSYAEMESTGVTLEVTDDPLFDDTAALKAKSIAKTKASLAAG